MTRSVVSMSDLTAEQIADEIIAERKPRRCETVVHVEPRPVFHTRQFNCASCGAGHQRYRDAAHTKPAAWCPACHAAYVRARRHT